MREYWDECIRNALGELSLTLTEAQIDGLVTAVDDGQKYYHQASYTPPSFERVDEIEAKWQAKCTALQNEFDRYRDTSERVIKKTLRLQDDDRISIVDDKVSLVRTN